MASRSHFKHDDITPQCAILPALSDVQITAFDLDIIIFAYVIASAVNSLAGGVHLAEGDLCEDKTNAHLLKLQGSSGLVSPTHG